MAAKKSISNTILNGLITIGVAAACACGSVIIITHEQSVVIDRLVKDCNDINVLLNEVKARSIANEVKIATHDASINRLQADMDTIKFKLASIPDRTEINSLLDTHYNRLSDQIDRLSPRRVAP